LLTTSGTWLEADPSENWVQRLPGIRFLEDVTFGNDAFVAVGSSGQIYSSKRGADWAFHGVNSAYSLYGVTYGGGQCLAVGTFALHLDPLTCMGVSTDGQSWLIGWDMWHPGEVFGSVAYGIDTAVAVNYYHNRLYGLDRCIGIFKSRANKHFHCHFCAQNAPSLLPRSCAVESLQLAGGERGQRKEDSKGSLKPVIPVEALALV